MYPNDGFDSLAVPETIQAERCTAVHGEPTMFIAELQHPRFKEPDSNRGPAPGMGMGMGMGMGIRASYQHVDTTG